MIQYHEKDGVPGKFFECPYGMGTMSVSFCADSHKRSKTKAFISDGRRKACRLCPIGSMHSGQRETISGSRLYSAMLCSRCERQTTRLVGGRICVSCYNRERESLTGLNAKGNPIKLIRVYYPIRLLLVKNECVQIKRFDKVLSTSEAVISTLLNDDSDVMFGWSGSKILDGNSE